MDWSCPKVKAKVNITFQRDIDTIGNEINFLPFLSKIEGYPEDGIMYDIRLKLIGDKIYTGTAFETEIAFLSPDYAKKYIVPVCRIKLWDRGFIGEGEIVELIIK